MRTAEFVSPQHPDKLCDQISDTILDECLRKDPDSRVAVETMGGHGIITVTGEITSRAYVDVKKCVESVLGHPYGVQVNLVRQSPEIASGVDSGGAGDQGIMVGYACNETPELMPKELVVARKLNQYLFKRWPNDGKTQVTLKDGKITAVVASFQHAKGADLADAVSDWLKSEKHTHKVTIYANPSGDWEQGGFEADTGLTGRKLVIDNY